MAPVFKNVGERPTVNFFFVVSKVFKKLLNISTVDHLEK